MRKTNSLFVVIGILLFWSSLSFAKGAVAFSLNPDGSWFVAADWNQPNMVLAEDNATARCRRKGGTACAVIQGVNGECLSVAVTNEGRYRLATGANQLEAQRNSINSCLSRNPGDSCVVRKSFCDNSTTNQFPCRSESGYDACLNQGNPGFGGATERLQYCRMAFC